MSQKITFIGECMVELRNAEGNSYTQRFSGDTLNTAVYLSRLTHDMDVSVHYVSAVGTDALSNRMLAFIQEEGVCCDAVVRIQKKMPGLYIVNTDNNGERSFSYWRNDSAAKFMFQFCDKWSHFESLVESSIIYLSGITLAIFSEPDKEILISLIQRLSAAGCTICFDDNYRMNLWDDQEQARCWYVQLLKICDIAFLSFDDEMALWDIQNLDDVFAQAEKFNITEVVVKQGDGVCHIQKAQHHYTVGAHRVEKEKVIDTTAAGDSFNAGYLAKRLAGEGSPVVCANAGHTLASHVIQHRGAIIAKELMPTSLLRN